MLQAVRMKVNINRTKLESICDKVAFKELQISTSRHTAKSHPHWPLNGPLMCSIPSKNNPISSRTSTVIHFLITQGRELIIRTYVRDSEALLIFVLVRVLVAAYRGAICEVVVALLDGGVDVGLGVAAWE